MLRTCRIDFKGNWDGHLPQIEFSYNKNYYSSIQMACYEALYRGRCRSSMDGLRLVKSFNIPKIFASSYGKS